MKYILFVVLIVVFTIGPVIVGSFLTEEADDFADVLVQWLLGLMIFFVFGLVVLVAGLITGVF